MFKKRKVFKIYLKGILKSIKKKYEDKDYKTENYLFFLVEPNKWIKVLVFSYDVINLQKEYDYLKKIFDSLKKNFKKEYDLKKILDKNIKQLEYVNFYEFMDKYTSPLLKSSENNLFNSSFEKYIYELKDTEKILNIEMFELMVDEQISKILNDKSYILNKILNDETKELYLNFLEIYKLKE